MNRTRGILYVGLGLLAVLGALLVPAYLRSLDAAVVERSGQGTPSLVAAAQEAARLDKLGSAVMLAQAAVAAELPEGTATLYAIQRLRADRPVPAVWGGADSLLQKVCSVPGHPLPLGDSVMEVVLPETQRGAIAAFLGGLRRSDVQEVMRTRALEAPVIFPPVQSASGQALDAAVLITGLLMQAEALRPMLRQQVEGLATSVNRGYDSASLEVFYLNLTSLSKRLTWDQLLAFFAGVRDLAGLRNLTRAVTAAPGDLPLVFAALQLAEDPAAVGDYLQRFPKTAPADLRFALGAGRGGLNLLLRSGQPLCYAAWRDWVLAVPGAGWLFGLLVGLSHSSLVLALLLKYILWLDGAFLIARAVAHLRPPPAELEGQLAVRGIGTLQAQTAAGLVVALALLLGEPGLARLQAAPANDVLWRFPKNKPAMVAQAAQPKPQIMNNQENWLALAVFFAVQMSVYVVGLIKLREIRRQQLPSSLKLKLLDNEENLFDTGLYVGLGGTGLALVLLALNLFTASPMIAYASTGFGVLFASLLKIIHVRGYRRRLILESETETQAQYTA